jgi:hypothetical protein
MVKETVKLDFYEAIIKLDNLIPARTKDFIE